jgi:hypothetical protein
MHYATKLVCLCLALLMLAAGFGHADERLAGIACRSVHLCYSAPEGQAFFNEVTVDQSAPGTYFCACGFRNGYYGIQELANGKKLVIFSVWDPGQQNDPKSVPENRRVKVLYQGEQVRVGRFGSEGTGAQSFFDYDWKPGQTCRFLVTAKPDGERTAYSNYFFLHDKNEWKHLVTFSTLAEGKLLTGYYSFVEDFRRNRVSATQPREARYGNGWIQGLNGKWLPLTEARFTADSNPATNINASVEDVAFRLATGGSIRNSDTVLGSALKRVLVGKEPPTSLPMP